MFIGRRSKNSNWFLMSSAVVGGFLLGLSYKKYGKDIKQHIHGMGGSCNRNYDDYISSHEPDA